MIKRFVSITSALLIGLCSSPMNAETHTSNADIAPFTAKYDLFRQGEKYGQGSRSFKKHDDGSYLLELSSEIEWLIFSDKRKEKSHFNFNNGVVQPISYYYKRTGTGSDKKLTVTFNDDKTLSYQPKPSKKKKQKKGAYPDTWQAGWLDEMGLHMQIQADLKQGKKKFSYTVVSKSGNARQYDLEVIGHEVIATGLGRFDAVKVARIYKEKKFYAQHAWFIPELDYTLARLWRIKKGVEQYDLVLNSYTPSK